MQINENMALRMVRYRKVLQKLKSLGMVSVFSNNLADALGVTPAAVRKDFSHMNMRGNKRGGYGIDTLLEHLDEYLGKTENRKVVIVGCGRIGQALIAYREFPREGITIAAGFDNNSDKLDRDADTPILSIEELGDFVKENEIDVGIIAVPESAAHDVFERMLQAGIRGILNITPVELKCAENLPHSTEGCMVRTVNIGLEVENLFCLIGMRGEEDIQ